MSRARCGGRSPHTLYSNWSSDTAELSFVDCPVPAANLVGAEGSGFGQTMHHFQRERISLAVQA